MSASNRRALQVILLNFFVAGVLTACGQHRHPPIPPQTTGPAWLDPEAQPTATKYLKQELGYTARYERAALGTRRTLFNELVIADKIYQSEAPVRLGNFEYYAQVPPGARLPTLFRRLISSSAQPDLYVDLDQLMPITTGFHLIQLDLHPTKDLLALVVSDKTGEQRQLLVLTAQGDVVRAYSEKPVGSVRWLGTEGDLIFTTLENLRPASAWQLSENGQIIPVVTNTQPEEVLTLDRKINYEVQLGRMAATTTRNFTIKLGSLKLYPLPEIDPNTSLIEGLGQINLEIRRHEGIPQLQLINQTTGNRRNIRLPNEVFTVTPVIDFPNRPLPFRVTLSGPAYPRTLVEIDPATGSLTFLGKPSVLPFPLTTTILKIPTLSDIRIPVVLVQRAEATGKEPLILEVYGAYGDPEWDTFQESRLPLLKRGYRFGFVHARGGGYLGRQWHIAGRGVQKPTGIDDFLLAIQAIVRQGIAQPGNIIIQGKSAGGLIAASVANLEPNLLGGVILRAPFVDVLNTMSDRSLPFTERELSEWGNPSELEARKIISSYSPLQNVRPQNYPAVFAAGIRGDKIIDYRQVLTWFSALRTRATDNRTKLFYLKEDGTHLGRTSSDDELWDEALVQAFIVDQVGG